MAELEGPRAPRGSGDCRLPQANLKGKVADKMKIAYKYSLYQVSAIGFEINSHHFASHDSVFEVSVSILTFLFIRGHFGHTSLWKLAVLRHPSRQMWLNVSDLACPAPSAKSLERWRKKAMRRIPIGKMSLAWYITFMDCVLSPMIYMCTSTSVEWDNLRRILRR